MLVSFLCSYERGGDRANCQHQKRYGEYGIESVGNSAVTGQKIAVVLDAVLTLEAGGDKVADLRDDRKHKAHQSEHEIVNGDVTEEAINDESEEKHSQNGEYNTADTALYRLLGADLGDKLMLAKESAHEVCERIAHPGADEGY